MVKVRFSQIPEENGKPKYQKKMKRFKNFYPMLAWVRPSGAVPAKH